MIPPSGLAPGWDEVVVPWWAAAGPLRERIAARESAGFRVFPPDPWRALRLTPLDEVKVVILGQDPYHGAGQAEGLAFSVPEGVKPPPSLRNILQEAVGKPVRPTSGSLLPWARSGVLLLNTALTVEEGQAGAHAKWGWESLTDALIARASDHASPKVFMLWGAHAQTKARLVDAHRHLLLQANHPSPLAARRPPVPFVGCGHFEAASVWLAARGRTVDWTLPGEKAVL